MPDLSPPAGRAPPVAASSPAAGMRADLPFAQGRSFDSLDAYLAHLRQLGAYDTPWYREVGPGLYRLEAGRGPPGRPPRLYTRRQLAERFGFP